MDKQKLTIRFKWYYNSPWGAFLLGGVLGIIVFVILYGIKVLDVTYVDWIYYPVCQDLSQHYFGWEFYRNSQWMFPLGLTDSLSYPLSSSVIFTDSIPHWALFFKVFSPILPQPFQYFGLFGLFCMFMQGGISALLLKELTNNTSYALIASLFFLFATPLSKRLFLHTALASQWLILFALYLYLCKTEQSFKTRIILWSILLWYTAGIHITILAICCIILGFDTLKTLTRGNIVQSIGLISIPLIIAVGTIYLYGGLTSETNPVSTTNKNGGLGWYGANLNMMFNPVYESNSTFLPAFPISNRSSDDGYSYLGVGGIILLIASSIYIFKNRESLLNVTNTKKILWTIIMIIIFSIIAISPRVTCGSKVLFEYHPPKLILWFWEVFRSTGRFMWPIYYLILIVTLYTFFNLFQSHIRNSLLLAILSIQLIDTAPGIKAICKSTVTPQRATVSISNEWDNLLDKKTLICFSQSAPVLDHPVLLQKILLKKQKINTYYFAHDYPEYLNRVKLTAHRDCLNPKDNTLYILYNEDSLFCDSCSKVLSIQNIDKITVGVKQ